MLGTKSSQATEAFGIVEMERGSTTAVSGVVYHT